MNIDYFGILLEAREIMSTTIMPAKAKPNMNNGNPKFIAKDLS